MNYFSEAGDLVKLAKALMHFILFIAGIYIILKTLYLIGMGKIFKKAGEKWWKVLIPYYSGYTTSKLFNVPMLIFFINIGLNIIVNILFVINRFDLEYFTIGFPKVISDLSGAASFIFLILLSINMTKAFGKKKSFALILIFLNVIGVLYLGLGESDYNYSNIK